MEANLRTPFVLIQAFARMLPPDADGIVIGMIDPVGLVADAALRIVHGLEGRAVGVDPDHGTGARAANSGQCDRPGHRRFPAPRQTEAAVRPAVGVRAAGPWHQPGGGRTRRRA